MYCLNVSVHWYRDAYLLPVPTTHNLVLQNRLKLCTVSTLQLKINFPLDTRKYGVKKKTDYKFDNPFREKTLPSIFLKFV